MIGPEVQKAIVDALMVDPPVAGGRIYDRVPEAPVFPYVSIGDEQVIDDGNSCDDGWEVYPDVHVWSRAVGRVEAKQLIAAIVPRLIALTAIDDHALVSVNLETSRIFSDPDGLTAHGVATFKLIINPA